MVSSRTMNERNEKKPNAPSADRLEGKPEGLHHVVYSSSENNKVGTRKYWKRT